MSENPIFSYTRRDYEGSRQEGLAQIPILSRGAWTDLNATDPGIIILDYVHALVDMMNYYQDHQALETFLSTAKERANVFRLAKQLSYNIRSAKGATCTVTFETTLLYNFTIKIPKYTPIATASGITYLTSEDAFLQPNQISIDVPCTQGDMKTINYQGTGISRFSNVVGAANQYVQIVDDNIDIDSIRIVEKDSQGNIIREWEPVDYLAFAVGNERVYQVELNPDNSVSIKFGDGERGMVPRETDLLSISYISTLAEEGRVTMNTLRNLKTQIISDGKYIEFLVNNKHASVGGSSHQSTQEIKELAPGAIKAQDRAVTLSDFENLAKLVSGVKDAKAYDTNIDPEIPYYEVRVYITPDDISNIQGNESTLTTRVRDYLSSRIVPPTHLLVSMPSIKSVDITVEVEKANNATEGRVKYLVEQTIREYFLENVHNAGDSFYPSDLIAAIYELSEVKRVLSMKPTDTVSAGSYQIISLGTMNVNVI